MPETPHLPTVGRLLELIDRFAGQRVILLADLVADRFITGTPKRISREAPVLILRYEGESVTPGGGANAAANVAAMDGIPLPLGVVGDDPSGRELLAIFTRLGVATEGILVRPGYRTPTKTRILAGGKHSIKQQIVRFDVEEPLELTSHERRRLIERLMQWEGQAGVAVLSDYGYGGVEPGLLAQVRGTLRSGGAVMCDSRYRLAEFRGLDGATPNEEEAEALLGEPINDDRGRLEGGGLALLRRLEARFLLITRGSRGMALFEPAGATHLRVHGTDQVADVTGAGDTVIGTFALALAAGAAPLEAALLANYAGGIVVMKMGTATLTRDELREAVRLDPLPRREIEWAKS